MIIDLFERKACRFWYKPSHEDQECQIDACNIVLASYV